ncbi:MAG TPA: glycosyltransferase, partial [Gemmatimonadales bacterium]|nr:glycosyltransferase [Gemmatimonadales bacterium]
AHAAVIGTGRERGRIEAQATRLGLTGRIHWCGAVPDAGHLFPAFDCFVLSSRTEGTPMVLFEAMAAATPIVTTRVGGVPDVVSEADAVLVPPGDASALAGAVATVLDDPQAARVRAERARARLDAEHGVARWVAGYDSVYRAVVRPGRGPARA